MCGVPSATEQPGREYFCQRLIIVLVYLRVLFTSRYIFVLIDNMQTIVFIIKIIISGADFTLDKFSIPQSSVLGPVLSCKCVDDLEDTSYPR